MIEIVFMSLTLLLANKFVNRGIEPRKVFTSTSAFLIGSWFYIVLNAYLIHAGHADDWGEVLLDEYPNLYTKSSIIVIVGTIFFALGAYFAKKPKIKSHFSVVPLTKKDKAILPVIAIVFFIPGNWAVLYGYNEALNSSYWDRTTSIVSISNLIIPTVLISVIGIIGSLKKGLVPLVFFGIILAVSVSGLFLLWSRRAVMGIVFVLFMVLYASKYGKPSVKPLFVIFPVLAALAIFLAFYRVYVFFGYSFEDMTVMGILDAYMGHLWLESSAFSALMYSAGPALENTLLYGSSFLAAFIFYIPRAIFPDKPYSYDLGLVIGDLKYNLPASFYGESIANFGLIAVPILAFMLGYFLKRIDHRFYSRQRNIFELSIYLLFAFNIFFMVRGSFSTVFSAAVIMALFPLIAYYILLKVVKTKRRKPINIRGDNS